MIRNKKRSIRGGIVWMLFLVTAATPAVITSCDTAASMPEINITMESDYNDIINAIKAMDGNLAEKLAEVLKAVNENGGKTVSALDLIKAAIESMDGSVTEKLAAIEEAIGESTLTLGNKLDLVEAAVENGFADSGEALELIKAAMESLEGTAEEKLAAIEEAIASSGASLGTKLDAIETAVGEGFASNEEALGLIQDAVESLEGTAEEKLAAVEEAIKNSAASLEKKLAAVESAVDSGAADSEKAAELIIEAIEALGETVEGKLSSIQGAISSQTTSLTTKIGLVEAAVATGAASNDQALELIKQALEAVKGEVEGIDVDSILTALEGITDYSQALATIIALLESMSNEESGNTINGYEYVEMGDGLKWATMNVGATKPEEYGDYFAWGETVTKTDYYWTTYKWMQSGQSDWKHITKYTFADEQKEGIWYSGDTFVGDGKTSLADYSYADDAARQIWKGTWRIPTDAEWTALRDEANFDWSWTDDYEGTGIAGRIVTSKVPGYEGNSIFLPAAGYRDGTSLRNDGSLGYYWSSSLDEYYSDYARLVHFGSSSVFRYSLDRYYGFSVRPVSGDPAPVEPEEPEIPDIERQWLLKDGGGEGIDVVYDFGYTFKNYLVGWRTNEPEYEAGLYNSSNPYTITLLENGYVKVEQEGGRYFYLFREVTETTATAGFYMRDEEDAQMNYTSYYQDEYGWTHGYVYNFELCDPVLPLTWRELVIKVGGKIISMDDANSGYPDDTYVAQDDFYNNILGGSDGSFPMVVINGFGAAEDFEGVDVSGKIVMVNRGGDIQFYEKLNNAAAAGAVAVICVNNVEDMVGANVTGATYNIPFFMVEKKVGEAFGMDPDPSAPYWYEDVTAAGGYSFVTVHDPNDFNW